MPSCPCRACDHNCATSSISPASRLQGAFAEAQAQFLRPDAATVDQLAATLRAKKIGVVAHFYMDPQVGWLVLVDGLVGRSVPGWAVWLVECPG